MMNKFRTHYDNLQVVENASIEVIRGAYKYLSQKWHPDKHLNDKDRAARIMKMINEAYSVLSDPERRQEHDKWIRAQREKYDNEAASRSESAKNKPEYDQGQSAKKNPKQEKTAPDESGKFFGGLYHPWRRYFARTVDLITGGVIAVIVVLLVIETVSQDLSRSVYMAIDNELVAVFILYVVWMPIEAVFLTATATTPAKWVFGISVKKRDGSKLSFSEALSRSFLVWVQGIGFAIPIVVIFTNYFAYMRLTRSGSTLWDTSVNAIVEHQRWGFLRAIFVIAVSFVSFFIVIAGLSQEGSQTEYATTGSGTTNNNFGFYFENKCNHPLELVLRYKGIGGSWHTEGGWNINGGASGYLQDENGNNLKTNSAVWYFYAKTTDGSNLEWRGDHYYVYGGTNLPMIELEDADGGSNWSTTCQ